MHESLTPDLLTASRVVHLWAWHEVFRHEMVIVPMPRCAGQLRRGGSSGGSGKAPLAERPTNGTAASREAQQPAASAAEMPQPEPLQLGSPCALQESQTAGPHEAANQTFAGPDTLAVPPGLAAAPAAEPAGTWPDRAAADGSAAMTEARSALDGALAALDAAGGGGVQAARSGSLSSLSAVSDTADAALEHVLRAGGGGSNNDSRSGSSTATSVTSRAFSSSTSGSSDSGSIAAQDVLDLPEAPKHRVAAPVAASAGGSASAGAAASSRHTADAAPAASAAPGASEQPQQDELSYSDITAMLAAGAASSDSDADVVSRHEPAGSGAPQAAQNAASQRAAAASAGKPVAPADPASDAVGGADEAAETASAEEQERIRRYLRDQGLGDALEGDPAAPLQVCVATSGNTES